MTWHDDEERRNEWKNEEGRREKELKDLKNGRNSAILVLLFLTVLLIYSIKKSEQKPPRVEEERRREKGIYCLFLSNHQWHWQEMLTNKQIKYRALAPTPHFGFIHVYYNFCQAASLHNSSLSLFLFLSTSPHVKFLPSLMIDRFIDRYTLVEWISWTNTLSTH